MVAHTHLQTATAALVSVAAFLWAAGDQGLSAWAQCGAHCGTQCAGGHAGHDAGGHATHTSMADGGHAGHADHQAYAPARTATPDRGPHGGQLTWLHPSYFFEVVYEPRQIRLYLYGPSQEPLSLRGARGEAVMRVRGQDRDYRFPLKYVASREGKGQDHLNLQVDLSRIREGDMSLTFVLQGLPDRQRPVATFTQPFALSLTRPEVTGALLEESDQAGLAQQKVCPVTGNPLGSHGTPIKLLVGEQPLYLCCRGCIEDVRKAPERYAKPVPRSSRERGEAAPPKRPQTPALSVAQAKPSDLAAIRLQEVCPVLGSRLGAHGTPIKIIRGDRSLFVCCSACVRRVQENPDFYFARSSGQSTR